MPSYISERYAGILTKEDIEQLFQKLVETKQGNRSEATRQCGLTGKATYDWEKATYLKLTTKQKVLDACLKTNFVITVEYLLSRSDERTVDVLRTILSTIYSKAVETESSEEFKSLLNKFETIRTQYRGLIKDRIDDEVNNMLSILKQIAIELGVPVPAKTIDDISGKELLDIFPLIVEIYTKNPQEIHDIPDLLDFPKETIEKLLPSFNKIRSSTEILPEEAVESAVNIPFHYPLSLMLGTLTPDQTPHMIFLGATIADIKKGMEVQKHGTSAASEEKCWVLDPSKFYKYCEVGGE